MQGCHLDCNGIQSSQHIPAASPSVLAWKGEGFMAHVTQKSAQNHNRARYHAATTLRFSTFSSTELFTMGGLGNLGIKRCSYLMQGYKTLFFQSSNIPGS